MKLLMLSGALAGFLTGLGAGWIQHVPWPTLLWRATLAAYVACLLCGWWGRHWSRNLSLAHQDQPVPSKPGQPTPKSHRP